MKKKKKKNINFWVLWSLIILCKSSGLSKISRDGLDIFKGYRGSTGSGIDTGTAPAISTGSGNSVGLDMGNTDSIGSIYGIRIGRNINNKDKITSIILFIFLILLIFLKINPFNNIVGSSGAFIIIIIFLNSSLRSFR